MIEGFLHEREVELLYEQARRVPKGGKIVEIGSYLGKSTAALASGAGEGVTVTAVDTWDNRAMDALPMRDTFKQFCENVREYAGKIEPWRTTSAEAAKMWGDSKIDLLFIDGDHSEEAVDHDLNAWVPFVKVGGVVIMHDYTEKTAGVALAFARFRVNCKRGMKIRIVASCFVVEMG